MTSRGSELLYEIVGGVDPDRGVLVEARDGLEDVLCLVTDQDLACRELARVLRPGGQALVYQMFATDRLDCVATSMEVLGGEWGEHIEERNHQAGSCSSTPAGCSAMQIATPNRSVAGRWRSSWATVSGTSTGSWAS